MRVPTFTITPDLRLRLACGTVALSTREALDLAGELARAAYLRQLEEREQRRVARANEHQAGRERP